MRALLALLLLALLAVTAARGAAAAPAPAMPLVLAGGGCTDAGCATAGTQPFDLRLSLGPSDDAMVVRWSTAAAAGRHGASSEPSAAPTRPLLALR